MKHNELGVLGENLAVNYLKKQNYRILTRTYRFKRAEVDIVCQKEDLLVIVEVKTRCTAIVGEPYLAVTRSKQRQIIQVADHFIRSENMYCDVRFDVISIVHNQFRSDLEHLINAFSPGL